MDKAREKIEAILTLCGVKGAQFIATDVTLALEAAEYRLVGPGEVDAETVEAACKGYWPSHWPHQFTEADAASIRGHMHAAVAAALRALGEKQDSPHPPKGGA